MPPWTDNAGYAPSACTVPSLKYFFFFEIYSDDLPYVSKFSFGTHFLQTSALKLHTFFQRNTMGQQTFEEQFVDPYVFLRKNSVIFKVLPKHEGIEYQSKLKLIKDEHDSQKRSSPHIVRSTTQTNLYFVPKSIVCLTCH